MGGFMRAMQTGILPVLWGRLGDDYTDKGEELFCLGRTIEGGGN